MQSCALLKHIEKRRKKETAEKLLHPATNLELLCREAASLFRA